MINPDLKTAFQFHFRGKGLPARLANALPRPRAIVAMERARKDVQEGKRRYPVPVKPYPAVAWQPGKPGLAYVENPASVGLRLVGRVMADTPRGDIWDNRENSGWYTDPYSDVFRDGTGLCYGVVYQLPGRNGESRFVAGYQFGGCDGGPTLDLANIYAEPAAYYVPLRKTSTGTYGGYWSYQDNAREMDSARTAAYAADSMAQHAAEQEREYQTAWAAGSRYADESHDVQVNRDFLRDILKERREVKGQAGYPALCKALRAQVADLLRDIAKGRKSMRELADGDYRDLIFWTGEERLRDAFCEGAGLDKFPA